MYIYLDGNYIEQKEATISPFDHGYMYGLGCFETIRIYHGHPFLLDDHLLRLQQGIETLNIAVKVNKKEIVDILNRLLTLNNIQDAYVRINISAGIGEIGLQTEEYKAPTFIIYMKPLPFENVFPPKKAVILTTKRNSPESDVRLKSHHYLNNILAKREIGNDPKLEGIFLTHEGYVAEGIVSNLFWAKDNIVYTPSIETGILDGITRQFILKWLVKNNIEVKIGHFTKEHLLKSDEAFITNSIQEVVPIEEVDLCPLQGPKGSITKQLIDMYQKYKCSLWSKNDLV